MSTENTITTAAADVAAAPNATLDELVGTTTNTAILPEPDAHAYDEIATGDADPLILGGHKFTSRFILGSGRYDLNLIKATIENAGTQIVTMAQPPMSRPHRTPRSTSWSAPPRTRRSCRSRTRTRTTRSPQETPIR